MDTVVHHEGHADNTKKEIVRITIYLSILTLVELVIGFYMYKAAIEEGLFKHFLKGVIVVLMMWKAIYIVGYFMHLKHEVRNLIMTIVVPLFLFIWFIIAFLADGNSYKNLRNKYDRFHVEKAAMKALPQEGHEAHGQHPEEKPAHHSGPTE
jgi:cytochrome c oxidase subunit IV